MSRSTPPVRVDAQLQPPLVDSPGFVLMQAGRLALEWAEEALALFELSVAQFAALAVSAHYGSVPYGAVAQRLGISKAGMSRVASQLIEAGLAESRLHHFDGRQRLLCITRAGAELTAEAADELAGVDAEFTSRTGEDVFKQLAELPPPNLSPIQIALLRRG